MSLPTPPTPPPLPQKKRKRKENSQQLSSTRARCRSCHMQLVANPPLKAFTSGLSYAICWYILASRHKNAALPGLVNLKILQFCCNVLLLIEITVDYCILFFNHFYSLSLSPVFSFSGLMVSFSFLILSFLISDFSWMSEKVIPTLPRSPLILTPSVFSRDLLHSSLPLS